MLFMSSKDKSMKRLLFFLSLFIGTVVSAQSLKDRALIEKENKLVAEKQEWIKYHTAFAEGLEKCPEKKTVEFYGYTFYTVDDKLFIGVRFSTKDFETFADRLYEDIKYRDYQCPSFLYERPERDRFEDLTVDNIKVSYSGYARSVTIKIL